MKTFAPNLAFCCYFRAAVSNQTATNTSQVNIFAHGLSGRPLAAFGCSISEPEAVTNLCQVIYLLSGIPAHEQRLILDEQILRMRFGKGEPPGSLQEICPKLLNKLEPGLDLD